MSKQAKKPPKIMEAVRSVKVLKKGTRAAQSVKTSTPPQSNRQLERSAEATVLSWVTDFRIKQERERSTSLEFLFGKGEK